MEEFSREKTNKVFKRIFPLKIGDRVKKRRKVIFRKSYWWSYGTIRKVYQRSLSVSVLWDGHSYTSWERSESLERVRPYGKNKRNDEER